jgi:hypothetical protein
VLVLGAAPACGYPTYGFVPGDSIDATVDASEDDTSNRDSSGDARDARDGALDANEGGEGGDAGDAPVDTSPCPVVDTGNACTTIPKFAAASQIVDGVGDEFCGIPATKLVANAGPRMYPTPPPAGIDTVMWLRIAWSTAAVHIHVRVDQAAVFAPLSTEELWRGDGIELFISGLSTLTGEYAATKDVGTFQIIAVPPQVGTAARAGVYVGSDGFQTYLDPAHFAGRLTPTGYELELKIDWVDLKATPTSGKIMGFDAAVDVRQTASSLLQLQSFIGYRAVSGTTPCGSTPRGPHPSCDDRTWCVPKLE